MAINTPDIPFGDAAFKQVNTGLQYDDLQGDPGPVAWMKENYNWSLLATRVTPNLVSDLYFYVNATTGSDSNNGLSADTAFLTINRAVRACQANAVNKFRFFISIANGTYEESVVVNNTQQNSVAYTSDINFVGSTNTIVSATIPFNFRGGCRVTLSSIKIQATRTGIITTDGARCEIKDNVDFKAISLDEGSSHIRSSYHSRVLITGTYRISGGAPYHILCTHNSVVEVSNSTGDPYVIQVSSSPDFTAFVHCRDNSTVALPSLQITYSGSASGLKIYKQPTSNIYYDLTTSNLPSGLVGEDLYDTYLGAAYATTPPLNDRSTRVPTTEWFFDNPNLGVIPVGGIIFYAISSSVPDGWIVCDGRSLSRTTYAALYGVIGTTWGGSGTTFNVPGATDRLIRCIGPTYEIGEVSGSDSVTLGLSHLPAHNHDVSINNAGSSITVPSQSVAISVSSGATTSSATISGTTANTTITTSTTSSNTYLTSPNTTAKSVLGAGGLTDYFSGFNFQSTIIFAGGGKSIGNTNDWHTWEELADVVWDWTEATGGLVRLTNTRAVPMTYDSPAQSPSQYTNDAVITTQYSKDFPNDLHSVYRAQGSYSQYTKYIHDSAAGDGISTSWPGGTGSGSGSTTDFVPYPAVPYIAFWRDDVPVGAGVSNTELQASLNALRTASLSGGGSGSGSGGSSSSSPHNHTFSTSATVNIPATTSTGTATIPSIPVPGSSINLSLSEDNVGSGTAFSIANRAIHLQLLIKY